MMMTTMTMTEKTTMMTNNVQDTIKMSHSDFLCYMQFITEFRLIPEGSDAYSKY